MGNNYKFIATSHVAGNRKTVGTDNLEGKNHPSSNKEHRQSCNCRECRLKSASAKTK